MRKGGEWGLDILVEFGRSAGSAGSFRQGALANVYEPMLVTHEGSPTASTRSSSSRRGTTSWRGRCRPVLHSLPFERPAGEGGRVVRDALFSMISQIEAGHGCPISMATAVVPALCAEPELAAVWEPWILTRDYDPVGAENPVDGLNGSLW